MTSMKIAKFFWCTNHHGNGMWFKLRKNWKCSTCKVIVTTLGNQVDSI